MGFQTAEKRILPGMALRLADCLMIIDFPHSVNVAIYD